MDVGGHCFVCVEFFILYTVYASGIVLFRISLFFRFSDGSVVNCKSFLGLSQGFKKSLVYL